VASDAGGWAERLAALPGFGDERVVVLPSFDGDGKPTSTCFDPWLTDRWLFGYRDNRRVAVSLAGSQRRDAGVIRFLHQHGWEQTELGTRRANEELGRFDQGGNILVTPPLPGYRQGRLVVGRSLQQDMKEFFQSQRIQAGRDGQLLEIDTDWLKVGHVDEIVAFVPAPCRQGFRVILPDFEAGVRLLASAPSERAVFYASGSGETTGSVVVAGARFVEAQAGFPTGNWKYLRITSGTGAGQTARIRKLEGRIAAVDRVWDLRGVAASQVIRAARAGQCETMPIWFEAPDSTSRFVAVEESKMWRDGTGEDFPAVITVGELAADPTLKSAATICAARLGSKESGVDRMLDALGVRPEEVLRLPVLISAGGSDVQAESLLPNPVNLVPLDRIVVLLCPFGPRANPREDSSDLYVQAWSAILKQTSLRPAFLDGWDALHRADGGARCGTQVIRKHD
jgi:hypothetical protein